MGKRKIVWVWGTICFLFAGILLSSFQSKAQLKADFDADITEDCLPITVKFKDLSSGNPTSYQWDFGNGNTSTLTSPTAIYNKPGKYTVKLTVKSNGSEDVEIKENFITVLDTPKIVTPYIEPANGCAPLEVSFKDFSSPGEGTSIVERVWDFGDGTTSTDPNPTHVYDQAGGYNVSLIVTNSGGCTTGATWKDAVSVANGFNSEFTADPLSSCGAPLNVQFNGQTDAQGSVDFHWDFGDGTEGSGAAPEHEYTESGIYTVQLTVSGEGGCVDKIVEEDLIHVGEFISDFDASEGCANSPISFENKSDVPPDSSHWFFDGGEKTTGLNVEHTFTDPGTYTVKLINFYGDCTAETEKEITVEPSPEADFATATPSYCSLPATVEFENTSSNYTSLTWDFGDGTSSNEENPTHIYEEGGSYEVTLTVENNLGCSSSQTKTDFIQILSPDQVSIKSDVTGICEDEEVHFSSEAESWVNITGYLWDFGDGSTSTQANPTHAYSQRGTYDVQLKVTTSSGCEIELEKKRFISVGTVQNNDFFASDDIACVNVPVTFGVTDELDDSIEYSWLFPDDGGTSEKGDHPQHSFDSIGHHMVVLEIYDNGCENIISKDNFIFIQDPLPRFTIEEDCENPRMVSVTDKSTGAESWSWDFGDGTTYEGQTPPPHTYDTDGEYTISLTVGNADCSATSTQSVDIFELDPIIKVSSTPLCKGNRISFVLEEGAPPGFIKKYTWDMGNGETRHTQTPNLYYTYKQNGTFGVKLTVTDKKGCEKESNELPVTIEGPEAQFELNSSEICAGGLFSFIDQSTPVGAPLEEWRWHFGDGDSSIQNTGPASHAYAEGGIYDPYLVVMDERGCSDTAFSPEKVSIVPSTADFSVSDTALCPGFPITWTNKSEGNIKSYFWDFGDGETSQEKTPTKQTYLDEGIYDVSLHIETEEGCTDEIHQEMLVGEPVAKWDYRDNNADCPPFKVSIQNNSENYSKIVWDFGDGSTSHREDSVEHIYNLPGNYKLRMIVHGYSPDCMDTLTHNIFIPGPFGIPNISDTIGCAPMNSAFQVKAFNASAAYWDFGDGSDVLAASPDEVVEHTYTQPIIAHPNLILEDVRKCKVSIPIKERILVDGGIMNPTVEYSDVCDSTNVTFHSGSLILSEINLDLPATYSWDFGDPNSNTDTSSQPVATYQYSGPGEYQAQLSVETQLGCTIEEEVLSRIPEPFVMDLTASADTAVCEGTPITLRADGAKRYEWTSTSGLFSEGDRLRITPEEDDTYKVVGYWEGDCQIDSVFVEVNALKRPAVLLPEDTTIFTGSTFELPVKYSPDVISQTWLSDYPDLDCTDCPFPVASPRHSGNYAVFVENQFGCTDSDSMRVSLICATGNIFIPNTFTPNKDGVNDVFYPRGRGVQEVFYFHVFDRWGNLIFEKKHFQLNDISAGWDGTFDGKELNAGVFIYQMGMLCDDGEEFILKGDITLLR